MAARKRALGRLSVVLDDAGNHTLLEDVGIASSGLLAPVFRDGELLRTTDLAELRALAEENLPKMIY